MNVSLGLLVLGLLAGGAPLPHPGVHAVDRPQAAAGIAKRAAVPGTPAPGPQRVALDPAPDPWMGPDKLQHFAMSFAATSFAYGAARFALDREPATLTATGAALAAGLGKEIFDLRAGRSFSARDLLWDAAGVAVALALVDRIR